MNIVEYLNEKGLTIASAESFTGGYFSNYMTNIPHASHCFLGSIISYDPSIKINVLGVNKETIDKYGTVSKECCKEMLLNVKRLFKSDIAVSFTGNAGPDSSEGKPVGLVYLGFSYKDKEIVNELHLEGSREDIKKQAVEIIISLILTLV